MSNVFIIISSLLALISPIIYSKAILKGEAKPHRTTWFVFSLITILTTASLFAQGNKVAIWLAGVTTLQSIFIFFLSIKRGMGGWSKSDILCLFIALIGIVLWRVTKNPTVALYFAIGADFIGIVPTLIKTYYHPDTEVWIFYTIDIFAALFSLLALSRWTPEEYSYPVYMMLINAVTAILIVRPKS